MDHYEVNLYLPTSRMIVSEEKFVRSFKAFIKGRFLRGCIKVFGGALKLCEKSVHFE